ncbi:MAG: hypothetical protein KGL39_29565 [Patescibacteria group bacterium]|nr:hypothetical protein [Patescibacteria group bacterium]
MPDQEKDREDFDPVAASGSAASDVSDGDGKFPPLLRSPIYEIDKALRLGVYILYSLAFFGYNLLRK